jgi:hypothetical protein
MFTHRLSNNAVNATASKDILARNGQRSIVPIAPLLCGIVLVALGLLRYVSGSHGLEIVFFLSVGLFCLWMAWWLTGEDEDKNCPDCGKPNSFDAINCSTCGSALDEAILMKMKKW